MNTFSSLVLALVTLAAAGCATTTTTSLSANDKTRHNFHAALPTSETPGVGPYNRFGQLYHYGSAEAYERAENKPLPPVMEASER